jgi:hypothetical protein
MPQAGCGKLGTMSRRKIKRRDNAISMAGAGSAYLIGGPEAPIDLPDARTWPVVRSCAPFKMAWDVSGYGTALIARERPDGLWAIAGFSIALPEMGVTGMFGKDGMDVQSLDRMIEEMGPNLPAMEPAPVEVVSDYVWGALAYGEKYGYVFPVDAAQAHLHFLPRPAGDRKDWIRRLVGRGGLSPDGLVDFLRRHPPSEDLPDGKETAVFANMTLQLEDGAGAVDVLSRCGREFIRTDGGDVEEAEFDWTRVKKDGVGGLMGGRQLLASIGVNGNRLVATVATLTWASRLVVRLHALLGGRMKLIGCTWYDPAEVFEDDLD